MQGQSVVVGQNTRFIHVCGLGGGKNLVLLFFELRSGFPPVCCFVHE
jgi:hypothetical protein